VTSDNRDWSKYNDALVRRGEMIEYKTIKKAQRSSTFKT